jgi:hypothetical protein
MKKNVNFFSTSSTPSDLRPLLAFPSAPPLASPSATKCPPPPPRCSFASRRPTQPRYVGVERALRDAVVSLLSIPSHVVLAVRAQTPLFLFAAFHLLKASRHFDFAQERAIDRARVPCWRVKDERGREGRQREIESSSSAASADHFIFANGMVASLPAPRSPQRRPLSASSQMRRKTVIGRKVPGVRKSRSIRWTELQGGGRGKKATSREGENIARRSQRPKPKKNPNLTLPTLPLPLVLHPSHQLPQVRAAANAAAATVGKKSATSAAAAAPSASAPVSLPQTFIRRSAPGSKETTTTQTSIKEASAPRGSLWEKMFF